MIPRDAVAAAYRFLFSREPTEERIADLQQRCENTDDLRRLILTSHDFQREVLGRIVPLCKPLDWPAMPIEVDVADRQLHQMIDRTERNFRHMGETEPHWSVLTAQRFLAENIKDNETEFFESGAYDVRLLRSVTERCGLSLDKFDTCFELGCGVGRTTRWLADQFKHVIGADISSSHLAVAQQTMTRFAKQNVSLLHVNTMEALEAAPRFDVFLSVIVLQHNPPPLIAHMLRIVLQKLRPGGLAYFQVPTYRMGYRFDAEAYIASTLALGTPEMHVLPQHVVLGIADRAGCWPLEVREDPSGSFDMISQRFLLQKLT